MPKRVFDLKNSEFSTMESIMASVINEPQLKQGFKNASIFKFWAKVVGKKFEKYSRAESLNSNGVLIVSCANASVSSELLMFKNDLIRKINQYSKPLGVEIFDINFSHKIWKNEVTQSANLVYPEPINPYKKDLTGFNPNNIELEASEIQAIKQSIAQNKFASVEQREKMFNAIILDLKIQKFVNSNKS